MYQGVILHDNSACSLSKLVLNRGCTHGIVQTKLRPV